MKKNWLMIVLFFVFPCVCSLSAQDSVQGKSDTQEYQSWEFIQIGFCVGMPSNQDTARATGIRIGAPISGGTAAVDGLEAAVLGAASDKVNGVQFSIVNVSKEVNGIQLGLVNVGGIARWLQLGVVNVADGQTFQIGLLNFTEDGFLPCFPLFNFKF